MESRWQVLIINSINWLHNYGPKFFRFKCKYEALSRKEMAWEDGGTLAFHLQRNEHVALYTPFFLNWSVDNCSVQHRWCSYKTHRPNMYKLLACCATPLKYGKNRPFWLNPTGGHVWLLTFENGEAAHSLACSLVSFSLYYSIINIYLKS